MLPLKALVSCEVAPFTEQPLYGTFKDLVSTCLFFSACEEVTFVWEGPDVFQIYGCLRIPLTINIWPKHFHSHSPSLFLRQCPLFIYFCLAGTFPLPRNAININKCSPWPWQGVCKGNRLGMCCGEEADPTPAAMVIREWGSHPNTLRLVLSGEIRENYS